MPSVVHKLLLETIHKRLINMKGTASQQAIFSSEKIKNLSIDYSTIELPHTTKWVRVYFSRANIIAYSAHMRTWEDYSTNVLTPGGTSYIVNQLHQYVMAWNAGKEFDDDNITFTRNMCAGHRERCQKYYAQLQGNWEYFQKTNLETEMKEYVDCKFSAPIDRFPYLRAYNYFFRKKRIDTKEVMRRLEFDIQQLDVLVNLVQLLSIGWDKCGKGPDFERYRYVQNDLLYDVRATADAIEAEIHLYELMLDFNAAIINFKLFPMN